MKKSFSLPIVFSLSLLFSIPSFARESKVRELVYDKPDSSVRMEIDEDQDDVYQAVQKGLIKPYSELSKKIKAELNGKIINVELEEDDDLWLYELKILHNNNVIKAQYDARTLELTELKGRYLMRVIKR